MELLQLACYIANACVVAGRRQTGKLAPENDVAIAVIPHPSFNFIKPPLAPSAALHHRSSCSHSSDSAGYSSLRQPDPARVLGAIGRLLSTRHRRRFLPSTLACHVDPQPCISRDLRAPDAQSASQLTRVILSSSCRRWPRTRQVCADSSPDPILSPATD
ncbi:hypothetical protein TWF696_004080 [Orbilia brochopaga]|uniref:Uncharacterized protein n=1 Tax=Orbilia brochopaga TaxID=3140254 RepID=A0AAV9V537_9PEZI